MVYPEFRVFDENRHFRGCCLPMEFSGWFAFVQTQLCLWENGILSGTFVFVRTQNQGARARYTRVFQRSAAARTPRNTLLDRG